MNLKKLLGICEHIWDLIETGVVCSGWGPTQFVILRCRKCGAMKRKEL